MKHVNTGHRWWLFILPTTGIILAFLIALLTQNAFASVNPASSSEVVSDETPAEYLSFDTSMTAMRLNFKTQEYNPIKVDFKIKINKDTEEIAVDFDAPTMSDDYVLNTDGFDNYISYKPMGGKITYHASDGSTMEDILFYNYEMGHMVYFSGEPRAWEMDKVEKITVDEPWGNPYEIVSEP